RLYRTSSGCSRDRADHAKRMIVLAMSPPKLDSTTTTSASISTANAHTDLPHDSEGPVTVRSWVAYSLPSSPRHPPMIPPVSLPPPDGSTATPVFTGPAGGGLWVRSLSNPGARSEERRV